MGVRNVTGTLLKIDNTPWTNVPIIFEISPGTFTTEANYLPERKIVKTNSLGQFSVNLWTNSLGTIASQYKCTLPSKEVFSFVLNPGDTPVSIQFLRAQSTQPTPTPQTILSYIDERIAAGGGTGGGTGGGGSSITWEAITGSIQMQVNRGYICNGLSLQTLILPSSAILGDQLHISAQGTGLYRIAQNAGQQIRFGSRTTSLGISGRIDSLVQGDSITLLYAGSNLWSVVFSSGNFDVA